MEAAEDAMAERIDLPLLLGSVNDLRPGHQLVEVDQLPKRTDSLYQPDLPLLWIQGQDLLSRTARWVPYEVVHTAYTLPRPAGAGCFVASSNGLASGNHLLEAISHGICEIVERDAATLHSLLDPAERALRLVDQDTIDDPGCREALDRIARAGLSAVVSDLTSDVGIPAFACLVGEQRGNQAWTGYLAEGMGCHPDPVVALLRALTEAAQDRLAFLTGTRDNPADWDQAQRHRCRLDGGPAQFPRAEAVRPFSASGGLRSDSLDADIAWELAALRSAGIRQVVAVDLTREDFGIPVVRVVIPGLEGPATTTRSCRLGRRAMEVTAASEAHRERGLRLPRPHASRRGGESRARRGLLAASVGGGRVPPMAPSPSRHRHRRWSGWRSRRVAQGNHVDDGAGHPHVRQCRDGSATRGRARELRDARLWLGLSGFP
jgi:ribosomal protein S12 methylthiotransferase accessory factor